MMIDKQTKVENFLQELVDKEPYFINDMVEQGDIFVLSANSFGLSKEDYDSEKVYTYSYLDDNSYSKTPNYKVSIDLKKLKYRFISRST